MTPQSAGNEKFEPTFERQEKILSMFIDNAKTYIQLSSAGLALSVAFIKAILPGSGTHAIASLPMVAMWLCLLLAVIAGAFYQYLAVKLLEETLDWPCFEGWRRLSPGTIYGVMLASFYGGATIFTAYAVYLVFR